MQQSQQASGALVGNTMATQVASPTSAGSGATSPQPPSTQHQPTPAAATATMTTTTAQMNPDPFLLTRLKNQVEFYFSPQNLARDTYLRGLMAQYGGSMVPLAVIASFPKVRELCATTSFVQGDPGYLLFKALETSNVVKITPDAYGASWISPLMPPPPLDPSSKQRHVNMIKPLPHLRQQSSGSLARTSSPLSNASYGDMNNKAGRTTVIASDIPTDIATEVVISAFTTDKVMPKSANPGDSNSWYVTFKSEQEASNAIATATATGKTINGHPIRAKIVSETPIQHAGKNSNKSSPGATTTTASHEGSGETDSSKSQNSNRHAATAASAMSQIPVQHSNYPTHMAPPQGLPNNAGGPGFHTYQYPFQPPFQYPAGRYPPHLQPPPPPPAHGMQYPPQMYGYQYMPTRPFYGGPNQPMFMRSMTDPGQMRPNQMKGKNNDKNSQMRKGNRNKKMQHSQFGYPDSHGGGGDQLGQRSNRGSRESLNSDGANEYNARKGLGRNNRDGYGQGGAPRRKTSPIMRDSGDNNFDNRMAMKGKKKKSKRRDSVEWEQRRNQDKTEIFDENMFPALSPSKAKATDEATTNVPNSSFSGYADALRQKNRPKFNEASVSDGKEYQPDFEDTINEMVESIQISQSADEGNVKKHNVEEVSDDVKPEIIGTELNSKHIMDNVDNANASGESDGANETKPILDTNEPTPKEASEISSKTSNDANTVASTINNESTTSDSNKNESSAENVGSEAEVNSAATGGAWSTKRSFIDVVKHS